MINRSPTIVLLLFWTLSLLACVSVSIKPPTVSKSSEYRFQPPAKPFEKMNSDQADHAWQNPRNGNTLAILTGCSPDKDPSLATLESDVIQALNTYKVLSSQDFTFQDRAAKRSLVEGTVDGIQVKLDFVIFKKRNCSYTLTYVGRSSNFDLDLASFEKFLTGFEAP
jgi:hypothetical protein